MEKLKLSEYVALLTYSHGNNVGNMQVSDKSEEAFSCSLQAIELAQQRVDTHFSYTSYAEGLDDMSESQQSCGSSTRTAASNEHEAEIDERVRLLLEMMSYLT